MEGAGTILEHPPSPVPHLLHWCAQLSQLLIAQWANSTLPMVPITIDQCTALGCSVVRCSHALGGIDGFLPFVSSLAENTREKTKQEDSRLDP